jgi:TPR repeat protein/tRNA A-37 threonylcarbamoyl transferase component Bud32
MTAAQRVELGAVFARQFRVQRVLAEGGMGTVYVAEQLSTGKLRALKVLLPEIVSDPRLREQFTQEARVGSMIGSAQIVDVVAAGVDEFTGLPWLAMELLDGEDLSTLVERNKTLAPEHVRAVFEQLGEALGAAHRAGVIHRDLKPENVFLARSNIRGVPFLLKVLDFGIARLVAQSAVPVSTTRALGSPLWLAPEQAQTGAPLSPCTDVWPLGLLAYHLLTGRYFWKAANAEAINLTALLVEVTIEALPLASVRAAEQQVGHLLPHGFDAWFARCVVREPEQRFADGAEACEALGRLFGWAQASSSAPLSGPFFGASSAPPPPPRVAVDPVAATRPGLGVELPAPAAPPPRRRGRVAALVVSFLVVTLALAAVFAWHRLRPPTTCDEGAAALCLAEGERYAAGQGVTADPARAARLFERACTLHDAAGCARLGDTLARGRGRDVARAASAYERACDGGQLAACASLGRLLADGRGIARDRVRAVRLYQKACDGHVVEGCVRLAVALRQGLGAVTQRPQSVQLLTQACRDQSAEGCMELGLTHLRGLGVAIDPVRALPLLERACLGNIGEACRILGDRYAQGRGAAPDAARALDFDRRARDAWRPECTNRRAAACLGLADLLAAGRGGPPDVPGAAGLYRWVSDLYGERCDRRGGSGCASLAAMYEQGQGVAVDLQRASALRERACEGGDSEVCVTLGDTYREGRGVAADPERAVALYARARTAFVEPCGQGDLSRCVALGDLLRDGLGGPPNPAHALEQYRRVCAAGEQRGCERLGDLMLRDGPQHDEARGTSLLQSACDAGETEACVALGQRRHDAQNGAGAVALYQRACDSGNGTGCTLLAGAYLRGESVPVSGARAAALYERACVADDFAACHSLARLLSDPPADVPPSRDRARVYFRVACQGGARDACGR